MTIAVTAQGATTPVSETDAIRLHQLARRISLTIHQMGDDYRILIQGGFVRNMEGLHELESLPVLMDLADESAREMLGMVEGIENAF